MKSIGIIRRIDDLGRIVIPMDVKRQLFGSIGKSEGQPMEIFIDGDDIILRKYEDSENE